MPPASTPPARVGLRAPGRAQWLLLAAGLVVLFPLLQYTDNVTTSAHGLNVWRSLADGRLLEFYSYNDHVGHGSPWFPELGSQYGFGLYLVFAIWNLPTWLLERAGVDVFSHVWTLAWMKAITIPFFVLAGWAINRLGRTLGLAREGRAWAIFLFASSVTVVQTISVTGQYDVVHTVPTILAVDAWLKGDRRKFLGWFALAACAKWFPLLVMLPLLLLVDKRLWRVAGQVLLVLVPAWLLQLPFSFDENRTVSDSRLLTEKVLAGALPVGFGLAPFVAAFGIAVLVAWLAPALDDAARRRWGMFAAAAPFLVAMMFTQAHPFWLVAGLPFVALAIVQRPQRTKVLLVVEMVWMASVTGAHLIAYAMFIWAPGTVAAMLLPHLFTPVDQVADPVTVHGVLKAKGITELAPAVGTVALVSGLALLWLLSPWSRHGLDDPEDSLDRHRPLLFARTALALALCLPAVACYLSSLR